jgi:DNA-binding transcriptional ArsR family regulator
MKKDEKQEGDVSDGAFSYGEMIVKELGNPKRAKTLHALNHRILRCEKLIRENKEKLTPKCYELLEDYKKDVLIQENVLITEAENDGVEKHKTPTTSIFKAKDGAVR